MSSQDHETCRWIDAALGDEEDGALRALLAACFQRPGDEVFLHRRYYLEPPEERFVLRSPRGCAIAAHAALRVRAVVPASGERIAVGGISEVCVAPEERGKGLARRVLEEVHAALRLRAIPFALLFGDERIYASSGYRIAGNVFRFWDPRAFRWVEEPVASALVRELSEERWPRGLIDLRGILF